MNRKSFLGRTFTAIAGLFATDRAKAMPSPVAYIPKYVRATYDHGFADINSGHNMDEFMVQILGEVNEIIKSTYKADRTGHGRVSGLSWQNIFSKDRNPYGTVGCIRVLFEYPISDREIAAGVAPAGK